MIREYIRRNVNKVIKPKNKSKNASSIGSDIFLKKHLTLEFPEELGLKPEFVSNIYLPTITTKNYMSSPEIGYLSFNILIDGKSPIFDIIMENLITNKFKKFDIYAIFKSKDLVINRKIKYSGCSFVSLNHLPTKKLKYKLVINVEHLTL